MGFASVGPILQGIGAVGGLIGGFGANSASKNAATAAYERETYNYKHRYRWQVDDMRLAGLNPVLAAGAAPGSAGGGQQANVTNPMEGLSDDINSANQIYLQNKLMKEQISNLQADTDKKKSEWALNDNLGAKTVAERELVKINQEIARSNSATARALADLQTAKSRVETDWYKGKTGRLSTALDKLNPLKFFSN